MRTSNAIIWTLLIMMWFFMFQEVSKNNHGISIITAFFVSGMLIQKWFDIKETERRKKKK
jgi:multisubunit Na+/H+ antiporter MnhE subunit